MGRFKILELKSDLIAFWKQVILDFPKFHGLIREPGVFENEVKQAIPKSRGKLKKCCKRGAF